MKPKLWFKRFALLILLYVFSFTNKLKKIYLLSPKTFNKEALGGEIHPLERLVILGRKGHCDVKGGFAYVSERALPDAKIVVEKW